LSTDAIVLLKDDHKEIRRLFREIGERMIEQKKSAPRSPAQPSAVKKVIDAVIA